MSSLCKKVLAGNLLLKSLKIKWRLISLLYLNIEFLRKMEGIKLSLLEKFTKFSIMKKIQICLIEKHPCLTKETLIFSRHN